MLFPHLGMAVFGPTPKDEWYLTMEKEKQNERQDLENTLESVEHFSLALPLA